MWVSFLGASDGLPHLFNLAQCAHIEPATVHNKAGEFIRIDGKVVWGSIPEVALLLGVTPANSPEV